MPCSKILNEPTWSLKARLSHAGPSWYQNAGRKPGVDRSTTQKDRVAYKKSTAQSA